MTDRQTERNIVTDSQQQPTGHANLNRKRQKGILIAKQRKVTNANGSAMDWLAAGRGRVSISQLCVIAFQSKSEHGMGETVFYSSSCVTHR